MPGLGRHRVAAEPELFDALAEEGLVELVDVHPGAEVLQQEDGELAAKVLAKLIEAGEHAAVAGGIGPVERGMVSGEPEGIENPQDAVGGGGIEQAGTDRIEGVERQTNGHGGRVEQGVAGEGFEFVRGPVAEVERPAGAGFERIAAGGDVVGVEEGGVFDAVFEAGGIERGEVGQVALDPLEKPAVFDEGDLDGFDQSGAVGRRGLGGEESEIVDDGEGDGERADPVFLVEPVDGAFDAHAAVVLGEGGGRETHQAHAAMGGGSGEADGIQKGPATNGQGKGMAVDVVGIERFPDLANQSVIDFDRFAAGQFEGAAKFRLKRAEIGMDGGGEVGPSGCNRGFEENQDAAAAALGQNFGQHRVFRGERISRENDAVLENNGDLEIVAGHQRAAVVTGFGALCHCFFNQTSKIMPATETLFETRWLGLYRIGRWDFVRRPQADACVGVLAITPAAEIVLVEQFRIPVQRRVIELPAGIVGDEEEHLGESLAETARRELLEETGYLAATVTPLITTPTSAGMTSEFMHLFKADGLTREHAGGGIAGEDILVHHVPVAELRAWLAAREAAGSVIDFKIHAALWLAGIGG